MAELIWQAANPEAGGHVATYNSGGARVEILVEKEQGGRMLSAPDKGQAPEWVRVAYGLAEKRIREYLEETGRMPGEKLLEDFQREMGKRLDDFIREPMRFPFRPMGLAEFEREFRAESAN
ncbi:MAG: hypothetical protein IKH30_01560 [Clostridia bacterium]|nr:hypothetical protein [Clostridia bacterium]MBR4537238.1 hypothetical protein [Clostridia bacterium]MBR4540531.1 hypothetical protein [Clostridia bacterium]